MQLFLGSYAFPVNGALVTTRTTIERSQSGRPLAWLQSIDVVAFLFPVGAGASNQEKLTNAEGLLRIALSKPYQDLALKTDSGSLTGTCLINAKSISGVVVTDGPNFEDGMTPEYVAIRTARFKAEARYLFSGTADALVNYQESITVTGNGGPIRKWRIPVNAPPIRQETTKYSIIRTVQQGSAIGYTKYPIPPAPIYGTEFLQNETTAVQEQSPTPMGRGWLNYPITWNYVYESSKPLVGRPRLPIL